MVSKLNQIMRSSMFDKFEWQWIHESVHRINSTLGRVGEEVRTFLSNITAFPVAFLGGATNTANGVYIFGRETFFIVENQQRRWSSRGRDVLRSYDELKRRIHTLQVSIVFRILINKIHHF